MADLDDSTMMEDQGRSKRSRVKSQRALESEQTDRLLARAKAQQRAAESSFASTSASPLSSMTAPPPRKKAARSKKKEEDTLYCICKSDGNDGRPMIECGVCQDWFHFYCIHLSESDAESIHKYVCNGCELRTGEKTTHIFDIGIMPSPSPLPGFELDTSRKPAAKPKVARMRKTRADSKVSASTSSSEDSGSEADNVSATSSDDDASDADSRPRPKKPRLSSKREPSKTKPTQTTERKPSIPTRKPSATLPPGALPPARAHVLTRLTMVIRNLFAGQMSDAKAEAYASQMEAALWSSFKEYMGGKDVVGSRYKGQFNLLSSSLSRPLRPELRESILTHTLSPAQVANLTSADLASEERAREIEAAKQAVLQQTVKSKEDGPAAIRLGRDGLERAEDFREKEMKALQAAETAAREKERREPMVSNSPVAETEGPRVGGESPVVDRGLVQKSQSEDTDIIQPDRQSSNTPLTTAAATGKEVSASPAPPTPVRQFSLSSAWGKKETDEAGKVDIEEADIAFGGDQNEVDLSDIVPDQVEEIDFGEEEETEMDSPQRRFEARPVVWKGGLTNPAFTMTAPAKIHIRHVATRAVPPAWEVLLPQNPIVMVGRVPSASSLKHLSDARLNPKMEMIITAFTCDPEASEQEKKDWNGMVQDHIDRDRHGLYHPYGDFKRNRIPPGGARELYFVPLRSTDPAPDFTELIDGFDIPKERSEWMYLGVFVIHRDDAPQSRPPLPAGPPPAVHSPIAPPPMGMIPPPAAPVAPNSDIQALLAKLDTKALGSIIPPPAIAPPGGPPVVGHPPGMQVPLHPQGGYTPPMGYYPPPQQYPPQGYGYPPSGGHEYPYPPGHGHGGYGYEQHQPEAGYDARHGAYDDRERREEHGGRDRGGRGTRGGGRGGRGAGFEGRERDGGWGSRR